MRSTLLSLALLAAPAHAGVTINEVLFDPSGSDGGNEWFELHNDGATAVDLSGWSVEAGTSSFGNVVTFSGVSIAPGGFLLVGDSNVPNTDVQVTMSLGNAGTSGDAIRLVDDGATVIDVVVYGPNNDDGWLDESGAVMANLAEKGASGSSIARASDGLDTGNLTSDFTIATSPTPGSTNEGTTVNCDAATGTVFINELLVDPAGSDSTALGEWVELHSTAAVDLDGWSIERVSQGTSYSEAFAFTATDTIAAGGFFLVGEANVSGADAVVSGTLGLYAGSGGDGVRLLDQSGCVVDTVVYGPSNTDNIVDDSGNVATSLAPDPGSDQSLARVSDGVDTDDCGVDFVLADTPSPGASNPVVEPPSCTAAPTGAVTINEFRPDPEGSDGTVLLEFVELHSTQAVDLEGWTLQRFSQADNFGTIATLGATDQIGANDWFVVGEANVTAADHLVSGALGLYGGSGGDGLRLVDCEGTVVDTVIYGSSNSDGLIDDLGNVATSTAPQPGSGDVLARREDGIDTDDSGADFWIATQPSIGLDNPTAPPPPVCTPWDGNTSLVINEFLPDPAGSDGEALAEWVELYSNGTVTIDLEGWRIQRNSQVDNHSDATILPSGTAIAAAGHLLIGEANVAGAEVVVTGTLGLYGGTNGDGLRLVDCEGTVVDTVVYAPPNDDQLLDDTGSVATSLAPKPGSDQSVARVLDGQDTDQSGVDFTLSSSPTPGTPNPEIICVPSDGSVVLNEVLSDPSGTDSEAASEFIELFNNGSGQVVLDGWWVVAGGQDDDVAPDVILPPETAIGAGGFFVIGNFNVAEADLVDVFSVPNGSDGDFVRLYDCEGTLVDTVIYGGENFDGIVDDDGGTPDPVTDAPDDDQSIARVTDGVDTNAVDDWFIDGSPSPGETNYQEPFIPPENEGGCNRSRGPGTGGDPGGGCAVVPLGGFELLLAPLLLSRRRRG